MLLLGREGCRSSTGEGLKREPPTRVSLLEHTLVPTEKNRPTLEQMGLARQKSELTIHFHRSFVLILYQPSSRSRLRWHTSKANVHDAKRSIRRFNSERSHDHTSYNPQLG